MAFRRRSLWASIAIVTIGTGLYLLLGLRDGHGDRTRSPDAAARPVASESRSATASHRSPIGSSRLLFVTGRVADVDGRPVSGAGIAVELPGAALAEASPLAISGPDGAFEVEIIEGVRKISVGRVGYLRSEADIPNDPGSSLVDVGTVILRRQSGIVGIVKRREGDSVVGAGVKLFRTAPDHPDRMAIGAAYMTGRAEIAYTTSGPDGWFAFESVTPGFYDVAAVGRQPPAMGFASRVKAEAGAMTHVAITMADALVRRGQVVDGNALPVAGADVVIQSRLDTDGRGSTDQTVATTSDGGGWFDIVLPSADDLDVVILRAHKDGVGIGHRTYHVSTLPSEVCMIELLTVRPAILRFVDGARQDPIADLRAEVRVLMPRRDFSFVRVTNERGEAHVSVPAAASDMHVIIDSQRWALPPGPGGLSTDAVSTGRRMTLPATGDATLTIALVPTGRIRGRVLDASTGDAVAGVLLEGVARHNVSQLAAPSLRVRATSGEQGSFELTGLPRCPVSVVSLSADWLFYPDGWRGETMELFDFQRVLGSVPLDQVSQVDDVIVKVVKAATVEGQVVDSRGVGVGNARVDLGLSATDFRTQLRLDEGWYEAVHATVSDEDGRFRLTGVWPTRACRLRASREGVTPSWSNPFDVLSGQHVRGIEIRAEHGAVATLQVVDPEGRAVGGAPVFLRDQTGTTIATGRTSGAGEVRFTGLRPARYCVGVEPVTEPGAPMLRAAGGTVIDAFAGETSHTIRLGVSPCISGIALAEGRTPIRGAIVTLQRVSPGGDDTGAMEWGRTDGDGEFRICVTIDGPYRVVAVSTPAPPVPGAGVVTPVAPRWDRYVPVGRSELRPGERGVVALRRRD
jgi:protocatechuate 3,4-dioxygenase beta subunit